LVCLVVSSALLGALYAFAQPVWATNDDPAMSMIAHGYGLAAFGSPDLVFSSVLWGYAVRALPSINGVLGYSIATLLVLFISVSLILYFLQQLQVRSYFALLAAILVTLHAAMHPQYTTNAGLAAVAASLGLWVYARSKNRAILVVSIVWAFVGYIIRSQEVLLVALVALPLVSYRQLRQDKTLQLATMLFVAAAGLSEVVDHFQYAGPEWQHYAELNVSQRAFTDFGAGEELRKYPEILRRFEYSLNDVDLLESWFFVDKKTGDPQKLRTMLGDLGPLRFFGGGLDGAIDAIWALRAPALLPLALSAMGLFLLRPTRRLAAMWLICLAALAFIGLLGRGAIVHVDIPPLALLCLAGIVCVQTSIRPRPAAAVGILAFSLLLVCRWNWGYLDSNARIRDEQMKVAGWPSEVVVDWGVGLPIEYVFAPLANDPRSREMRLLALGALTYAPFSVAYNEEQAGRGFVDRIRSPQGVLIIAGRGRIAAIAQWCAERFSGKLQTVAVKPPPLTEIQRVRCESGRQ
jgi:hypothetical protein